MSLSKQYITLVYRYNVRSIGNRSARYVVQRIKRNAAKGWQQEERQERRGVALSASCIAMIAYVVSVSIYVMLFVGYRVIRRDII